MRARIAVACVFVATSIALPPAPAQAQSNPSSLSELSALSLMPVALSATAAAMVLASGVALTVVAVEASVEGTVLIVERASDGARETLRFSGRVLGGASQAIGTALSVIAVSGGWVLCTAGQVLAFVPNEIGAALLYNERISR